MSLFDDIFHPEGRKLKKHNTATASLFDDKSNFLKEENTEQPTFPLQSSPPIRQSPVSEEENPEAVHERTIFVGNLSLEIKQLPKKLKRHFASCGDVASVRLRSVPAVAGDHAPKRIVVRNKRFRHDGMCNAYIVFRHPQGARTALDFNMTHFYGQVLRVDMAGGKRFRQRRNRETDPGNFSPKDSICVKHLEATISDEALLKVFNDGTLVPLCRDMVRNWRIVRDHKTGESKGYGFVAFKHPSAAKAAHALDGYTLGQQPIKIESLVSPRVTRGQKTNRKKHVIKCGGLIQTKGRFKRRR